MKNWMEFLLKYQNFSTTFLQNSSTSSALLDLKPPADQKFSSPPPLPPPNGKFPKITSPSCSQVVDTMRSHLSVD